VKQAIFLVGIYLMTANLIYVLFHQQLKHAAKTWLLDVLTKDVIILLGAKWLTKELVLSNSMVAWQLAP